MREFLRDQIVFMVGFGILLLAFGGARQASSAINRQRLDAVAIVAAVAFMTLGLTLLVGSAIWAFLAR